MTYQPTYIQLPSVRCCPNIFAQQIDCFYKVQLNLYTLGTETMAIQLDNEIRQ